MIRNTSCPLPIQITDNSIRWLTDSLSKESDGALDRALALIQFYIGEAMQVDTSHSTEMEVVNKMQLLKSINQIGQMNCSRPLSRMVVKVQTSELRKILRGT